MQSLLIMFIVIISNLFLFFPLSSKCNPDDVIPYPEKDWLDRCDINRLKKMHAERPTSAPSPDQTTKNEWNKWKWWFNGLQTFPFRPLADTKEILDILKQKLRADSKVRDESAELDPWINDARAFDDDEYDYAYYEENPQ